MFDWIRTWLRNSTRVHIREENVSDVPSMIDLVDRFIDGPVRYPFEWDDFVTWKHPDPVIDHYRRQMEALDPLLLRETLEEYAVRLVEIRNRIASEHGLQQRALPESPGEAD